MIHLYIFRLGFVKLTRDGKFTAKILSWLLSRRYLEKRRPIYTWLIAASKILSHLDYLTSMIGHNPTSILNVGGKVTAETLRICLLCFTEKKLFLKVVLISESTNKNSMIGVLDMNSKMGRDFKRLMVEGTVPILYKTKISYWKNLPPILNI